MKKEPYLISIIIPVYNAENTIIKCLNSIKNQTYKNYEVVIVNDGSSDDSLNIIENNIKYDSRFKLLNQPNKGVSSARNLALNFIKGEWVIFIDSDDYLMDNYLSNIINSLEVKKNIDLIITGWTEIIRENGVQRKLGYIDNIYTRDQFNELFNNSILISNHGAPWAKVFKNKIIIENSLRFNPELHLSEDRLFLYNYLIHCNVIQTINSNNYYYIISSNSTIRKRFNPYEELLRIDLIYKSFKNIQNEFKLTKNDCHIFFMNILMYIFRYLDIVETKNFLEYCNVISMLKLKYPLNLRISTLFKDRKFNLKSKILNILYILNINFMLYTKKRIQEK